MNFNDLLQTVEKSKRQLEQASKPLQGKLCYFWDGDDESHDNLTLFRDYIPVDDYPFVDVDYTGYAHCRPLTREEVERLLYKE